MAKFVSVIGQKILWEKEKMLVTSIFPLYPQCFQMLSFSGSLKVGLCVNPFPNKPWFLRVCCVSLLKTLWEKEKLVVRSNFSFSQYFLAIWRTFLPFSSNLKFSSAESLKCCLGKGYRFNLDLISY